MKMVTQIGAWPGDKTLCPADFDFAAWIEAVDLRGASIFHMGPGRHHLVGRSVALADLGNSVLAISNCEEEVAAYARMVVDEPVLSYAYKVFFGDIYMLNAAQLPLFDVVTLFHLGEMPDDERMNYARLDDCGVVELLASRLQMGGRMLFYPGSSAWDRSALVVEGALAGGFGPPQTFASLEVRTCLAKRHA